MEYVIIVLGLIVYFGLAYIVRILTYSNHAIREFKDTYLGEEVD